MEVMFLDAESLAAMASQSVAAMGALVVGFLLLAGIVAAVACWWVREEPVRAGEEREPLELKKAA